MDQIENIIQIFISMHVKIEHILNMQSNDRIFKI